MNGGELRRGLQIGVDGIVARAEQYERDGAAARPDEIDQHRGKYAFVSDGRVWIVRIEAESHPLFDVTGPEPQAEAADKRQAEPGWGEDRIFRAFKEDAAASGEYNAWGSDDDVARAFANWLRDEYDVVADIPFTVDGMEGEGAIRYEDAAKELSEQQRVDAIRDTYTVRRDRVARARLLADEMLGKMGTLAPRTQEAIDRAEAELANLLVWWAEGR